MWTTIDTTSSFSPFEISFELHTLLRIESLHSVIFKTHAANKGGARFVSFNVIGSIFTQHCWSENACARHGVSKSNPSGPWWSQNRCTLSEGFTQLECAEDDNLVV